MLNRDSQPVAWALLLHELDDARGHLETLVRKMIEAGAIDEIDYGIRLGHIYTHLNRAWHGRDSEQITLDPTPEQRAAASKYPQDLEPNG